MKTKLLFIVIVFFCNMLLCKAQTVYGTYTLYTPKGTSVTAYLRTEMSQQDIDYYNYYVITHFPAANSIASSTYTYNCHGYAWSYTEGGPTCWLDQYYLYADNLNKYWTDGSFEELGADVSATKIFYYNDDHSAVKSSISGKYESKWGYGPLMRHDPGYGPYTNMQYRKYYRKAPIVITCPSLVCVGSSYTFSVTGATPHGYYWNTSSNLSMSGSGGSISVTGNANGAGWVSIMHSGV